MKKLTRTIILITVLGFSLGLGSSFAQAQSCSREFPNGSCPTGQRCQVLSMGADNLGEYGCVNDTNAPNCGNNSAPCPSGTQCVSSGGTFSCVRNTCSQPDPSNTAQSCSCAEIGGNFVWQCELRRSAEAEGYVCYDFNNGQCTNWVPKVPTGSGNLTYTPLEPLPGLENAQSGQGNFAELVGGIFRILINLGAFLAVVVLVLGGISYMFSEATVKKLVAKERIKAALWGLAILAASWLILNTINPQLISFREDLLSPAGTASGGQTQNNTSTIDTSVSIANFSGSTVDMCGTPTCELALRGQYITFDPRASGSTAVKNATEAFKTKCEVPHSDQLSLDDRMGVVQTFDGRLVNQPGRTGYVCVLE